MKQYSCCGRSGVNAGMGLAAAALLALASIACEGDEPAPPGDSGVDSLAVDLTPPDSAPLPTCTDKTKNGDETDVDCGGATCPACADGKGCSKAADCKSGVCTGGICAAASCTDSVKNGDETDVDCGGGTCPACPATKVCSKAADCKSGVCDGGVCDGSDLHGLGKKRRRDRRGLRRQPLSQLRPQKELHRGDRLQKRRLLRGSLRGGHLHRRGEKR